jgi:hypothetical protein
MPFFSLPFFFIFFFFFCRPPLSRTSSQSSFVGKLEEPEEEAKQVKFQPGRAPSTDEGEMSTPLPGGQVPSVAETNLNKPKLSSGKGKGKSGKGKDVKKVAEDEEIFTPREDSVIVVQELTAPSVIPTVSQPTASAAPAAHTRKAVATAEDSKKVGKDSKDSKKVVGKDHVAGAQAASEHAKAHQANPNKAQDVLLPLEQLQLLFPELLEEVLCSLLDMYQGDTRLCHEWLEMKGWKATLPPEVMDAASRVRKRGTISKGWGSVKAALRSKNTFSSGAGSSSRYGSGGNPTERVGSSGLSSSGSDRIGVRTTFGRVRGRRDFLAKSLNQTQQQAHAN